MVLRGGLRSVVMLIVALWIAMPARAQACNCLDGQICGKGSVGNPFRCCDIDHDSCMTRGDPCPTTRCDPSPACCILLNCTAGEQCSSATDTCVTFRSTCDGGVDAQSTDAAGHDAAGPTSTEAGPPADASGADAASRGGRATDVDGNAGGRGASGTRSSHDGSARGAGGAATPSDGGGAGAASGESLDGSLGPDLRGVEHTDASGCGCHAASTAAGGRSSSWPLLAAAFVGRGRRRRGGGQRGPTA